MALIKVGQSYLRKIYDLQYQLDLFQTVNRTLTDSSDNQSSNADKALKEDFSWIAHQFQSEEYFVLLIGGKCDRRDHEGVKEPWKVDENTDIIGSPDVPIY